MTLKYSLTEQQEQQFWSIIASNLSEKLNLPRDHSKWQLSHRKAIDKAMRISLYELCKSSNEIAGLCNFFDNYEELLSGQRSFLSTIHSYFKGELPKRTHDYNKHRFTFFLFSKSANTFIEEKEILNIDQPVVSYFSEPYGSTNHFTEKNAILATYTDPFINRIEFYAYKIIKKLDKHPNQVSIQKFRTDFMELHQKLMIHFVEKKDLRTGIDIFLSIYELASKTFLQKEDGKEVSILSEFGGFGFYLRDESVTGNLKKYLAYSDNFALQIEAFKRIEYKTEEDYDLFFRELLNQHQ